MARLSEYEQRSLDAKDALMAFQQAFDVDHGLVVAMVEDWLSEPALAESERDGDWAADAAREERLSGE